MKLVELRHDGDADTYIGGELMCWVRARCIPSDPDYVCVRFSGMAPPEWRAMFPRAIYRMVP